MRQKLFLKGWEFLKTSLEVEIEELSTLGGQFKEVSLPHDWLIFDTYNLYENSIGWYRRCLPLVELVSDFGYVEGERVYLRFDGVYMDCTLYVNGQEACVWKYGYSAFHVDITEYLQQTNELLLKVVHQSPNSRWYTGAGIYRDVFLRVAPKEAHLAYDGTYVHLQEEKDTENFTVVLQTEVLCKEKPQCKLIYTMMDPEGEEVFRVSVDPWKEKEAGCYVGQTMMWVEKPVRWDIEDPSLYSLQVELVDLQEHRIDEDSMKIGFKTMEFHPDKGFLLNDRVVKVHGVCEHHDFGALGGVFYEDALRRKFRILKEMGVNAIRSSHNMPAKRFMEIADEVGMLVVSEAFDMWESKKTDYDYARFFKQWYVKDVASWVRRDRNHASLMMWSIGNEIYDTHASEHGQEITRALIEQVRLHDKLENAPITIGSNFMPWENAQKCADIVKLAGYNYGEKCYDEHHAKYPDWVIYGSETSSIVQSRGVYHFPYKQSLLADEDEQCSALGNSTTSWGAKSVEKCIADDRDRDFAFGQFLWTGFDYIGEPTPYHTKNSYFGQVDTAGFPKDAYYIYQAEWGDLRKPMVHVFPYWDFNEGQLVDVRICSNGQSVELLVNGESQGKKQLNHSKGTDFTAHFQVPYKAGEICAIAYDKEGKEIARESRHSFGEAVAIEARADQQILKAGTRQLSFVTIFVVDEQGYPVENAMNYVKVDTQGPIRLLGLDNGDSTDFEAYKSNVRKLFNGKLLAVVGVCDELDSPSNGPEGSGNGRFLSGTITVSGKGLRPATIEYQIVPNESQETWQYKEPGFVQKELPDLQPVRKILLSSDKGQLLCPECPQLLVTAKVLPQYATDKEVTFKVVNDAGIELDFVTLERVEGNPNQVKVKAQGDGEFKVRAVSKSGTEKTKILSQLEFSAKGFGQAYLNPYGFITGGLYESTYGEISNGNEQGFATARGQESGVKFVDIDFGQIGSDVITLPIFALSSAPYAFQIWEGEPNSGSENLLLDGVYEKPSKWNVYQEETYTLYRRVKGITSLSFLFHDKVHMKGFSFQKYEKAFELLPAASCDKVYGDTFKLEGERVYNIGNNVTLVFEDMDFGQQGTTALTIKGRSNLPMNTIHIHFLDEEGNDKVQVVEFTQEKEFAEQTFALEKMIGRYRVEFVFLPGSKFDFESLRFLVN